MVSGNKLIFPLIILFLSSLLIYGRAIHYEFVWDDERSHLTRHNDFMQGKIGAMWSKPYDGMYIPVAYTAWYAVKKISAGSDTRLDPKPFHAVNVILHGFNSMLVFLLLVLFFNNSPAALAGSMVFLLHPLQVESVAWISEFRGLLSTFFSLGALYLFFNACLKNSNTNALSFLRSRAFLFSTLLFTLALLSKPSAVALPFIAGLLAWCFSPSAYKGVLKSLTLWLLVMVPVILVTGHSQKNDILSFVPALWQRPLLAGDSVFFYFSKLLVPIDLAACYGKTPELMLKSNTVYLTTALVGGLFLFLFIKRNAYRHLFTGCCIILAAVIPVSGLVSFYYQRYSNVADRYMYLGMLGAALIISFFWIKAKQVKALNYAIPVLFLFFIILTVRQIPVWKNEFAMWDNSAKLYPDQWTALYNRAVHYGKAGQFRQAIDDYTRALIFNPADKNIYLNRANAFGMVKRFEDALADYSKALELSPGDGSAYYNRALTYYNMGELTLCIRDLHKAQELKFPFDPGLIQAVNNEWLQRVKL